MNGAAVWFPFGSRRKAQNPKRGTLPPTNMEVQKGQLTKRKVVFLQGSVHNPMLAGGRVPVASKKTTDPQPWDWLKRIGSSVEHASSLARALVHLGSKAKAQAASLLASTRFKGKPSRNPSMCRFLLFSVAVPQTDLKAVPHQASAWPSQSKKPRKAQAQTLKDQSQTLNMHMCGSPARFLSRF